MYAIRSYYGVFAGSELKMSLFVDDTDGFSTCGFNFIAKCNTVVKGSSDEPDVITSYSIHYTKLYDISGAAFMKAFGLGMTALFPM